MILPETPLYAARELAGNLLVRLQIDQDLDNAALLS